MKMIRPEILVQSNFNKYRRNKMRGSKIFKTILAMILIAVLCINNVSVPGAITTVSAKTTGDAELDEAVRLGIISYKTAKKAKKNALEKDIPPMLQAVYRHGYGKKSKYLAKMTKLAKKGRKASRYWFAMGMFYSYCEHEYGAKVKNAKKFMDTMDKKDYAKKVGFGQFDTGNVGVIHGSKYLTSAYPKGTIADAGIWDLATDADAIPKAKGKRLYRHESGNWWAANIAMKIHDRVTGENVLGLDSKEKWNPAKQMTIGDAAKAALRWWHSFEKPAKKVRFSSIGTYDKSIITDKLLSKTTTLPANSCQNLPADWKGIFFKKLSWVTNEATDGASDRIYRENEFKEIKEAGFNFIRLNLSFSYLQAPNVKKGMINETRLKELDSILAYCMKYDMHLSIVCNQYQDFDEFEDFDKATSLSESGPKTQQEINDFAIIWGGLAHRYAAIPNEYLSFELYNEIDCTESEYAEKCSSAVDAIRKETPNRTIIANIHSNRLTGESVAALGVALSYHLYDPRKFCCFGEWPESEQKDENYVNSIKWPFTSYGYTYDAKMLLDAPLSWPADMAYDGIVPESCITVNKIRAVSKKYNVGFIVNEWGVFGAGFVFRTCRYPDETYQAYLSDVINTFKEEGIPWCVDMTNEWGLIQPYPFIKDVKYKKTGVMYIDTGLKEFYSKINKL